MQVMAHVGLTAQDHQQLRERQQYLLKLQQERHKQVYEKQLGLL
jgi:hypothetical protein